MKIQNRSFWVIGLIGLSILICLPAMVSAGDLDPFKAEKGMIKISGGTAHIPVMKEVAKQIMTFNPNIQIMIAGGGSGVGINQVGEGMVDIGNSGRKPTDSEVSKYGLKLYKWAIDGVGVVVNPQNPVKNLTRSQLKDVFARKIKNWKDLGGPDKTINVYTRDNASGTREVFWKKGLDKGDITPQANVVVSNGAMKSAVANDPMGIGYVSVGHIDSSVSPVALDGVVPSRKTVQDGTYKIARGLYSNTKGTPSGLVLKFIHFLYSSKGHEIAGKKGFIPVDM